MSQTITVTISDTEYKALEFVANNPTEWIQNMVTARALSAKQEISKVYVDLKTEQGQAIPGGGIDAHVTAAYAENIVQTIAQREADFQRLGS